ncbi:MAG: hypothetical protein V5A79_06595 [Candidatus Bipolaricaulota bacterium]
MPHIVYGNPTSQRPPLGKVNYDYDYPEGRDLAPREDLHDKLVDAVMERAIQSHTAISSRFDSWREIDRLLTGYIPIDEDERRVKEKDPRKPTSIVFPYSYAVQDTLLTYLTLNFLKEPIFQYEGFSPEDTIGAGLMEKVIARHCKKNKVGLAIHTMFRDAICYGIGPVSPGWHVRRGTRRVKRSEGRMSALGRLVGRQPVIEEENAILFEGNDLYNIDPYNVLPDANVSIHRLQDGEFFGWIEETSVTELLNREVDQEEYFNCRYLKHLLHRDAGLTQSMDKRAKVQQISSETLEGVTSQIDVVHMYLNIIPKDWDLGDSEYPEKWLVSVAAGEIVIRAHPLNLNHGMYPVAVAAPDFDGYGVAPMSKLENLYGLQEILNWMFNSHVTNVRKAINDMFVVDPYLINMNDLKDPEAGKMIRMRRPGWGRGVKDAVMQLGVNDVTRQNVGDSSWIINWMNNIVGTDESMMGALREGGPERLTKAEFEGTRSAGMSRLSHMGRVVSMQAMQDIGYFFASHAQQMMSEESWVSIIGRHEDELKAIYQQGDKAKVRPEDLLVDYDVDIKTEAATGGNTDPWINLFKIVAEHPELQQELDVTRVFKHVAKEAGADNVEAFQRKQQPQQTGIMGDEQIQREVEKGNLRPAEEGEM